MVSMISKSYMSLYLGVSMAEARPTARDNATNNFILIKTKTDAASWTWDDFIPGH